MDLKLYHTETCRYCHVVMDFIEENDLDVELVDATYDVQGKRDIINKGGKMQVPMLLIDDEKAMYESKDIIAWLDENLK